MQHIKILSLTAEVAVGLLKNSQDEIKWYDHGRKQVSWRNKKNTVNAIQKAALIRIAGEEARQQGYGIQLHTADNQRYLIEASMDKVKHILEKH